jgi:hypothetical protein
MLLDVPALILYPINHLYSALMLSIQAYYFCPLSLSSHLYTALMLYPSLLLLPSFSM